MGTVREVLRDDFGVTVKPKTIQVPGIVSDLARLGDGMLQSLGFYNQEGNDSCGTAFEIASQTTIARRLAAILRRVYGGRTPNAAGRKSRPLRTAASTTTA